MLIEYRWAANDDRLRQYATELVAFAPNGILAFGGTAARIFRRVAGDLPVVFVNTSDPVASGLVGSLARPEGNMTGFLSIEYGRSAKWHKLLKEIAPQGTRAAVIRDPVSVGGTEQFDVIQGAASSFGVEISPIDARDNRVIEHGILKFVRRSNSGLIVTTGRIARYHRDLIIALAKQYALPAVYSNRYYVIAGGLMAYGADLIEQLRQAAGLRQSDPQGRKASRPSSAGAQEIRIGN
jgi:putative tryptophan/tyrosine transport system substrate-binding protein